MTESLAKSKSTSVVRRLVQSNMRLTIAPGSVVVLREYLVHQRLSDLWEDE